LTKNINPLAFRLAALQVHYRKEMEYSEDSILQAERALISLYRQISQLSVEPGKVDKDFQLEFLKAINDDLNMPQALAVLFQMLKSDLSDEIKLATALKFDQVLGLSLQLGAQSQLSLEEGDLPREILSLLEQRKKARQDKNWSLSDSLREEINELGYLVEDSGENQSIKKK
jgi:cysteinyl-tRNA synthetase